MPSPVARQAILLSGTAVKPVWLANFLTASSLPAGLTASGGANGTYFNSSGVLTSGSAPRFDYNPATLAPRGLLVEEQRVNIQAYSQVLTTSGWTAVHTTSASGSYAAPDGTNNAILVTENSATAIHQFWFNTPVTTTATAYTVSAFMKQGSGSRYVTMYPQTSTVGWTIFDLTNGVIKASGGGGYLNSSITSVGNGWYRCSVTWTASAASLYPTQFYMSNDAASPAPSYAGNGSSSFYVWGVQVEAGSFPTSYIPNPTASTVTRTADVVSFTGIPATAIAGSQGALVVQLLDESSANPAAIKSIIKGTNNILYHDTTGKVGTTDGTNILLTGSAATWSAATRVGLSWRSGSRILTATGLTAATDTNTASNGGTLYLGSSNGSAAENCWIQGASIYATSLISATLQSKMTVNGSY